MRLLLSVLFLTAVLVSTSHAATPDSMSYQGYITDSQGNPRSTPVSMTFSFYSAASGGEPLWFETQEVTPENGIYDVVVPIQSFRFGPGSPSVRYLGVKVGNDPEMSPRQQLLAVPFAKNADFADAILQPISISSSSNAILTATANGTNNSAIIATSGGAQPTIKATSTGTGPAGSFTGDVTISGNLNVSGSIAKLGGTFRIDHPLDPRNKYLSHSFVESPDMMNIYNGNVTLDEKGEAAVTLPEWFSALNRDFRYQLTAIGAPGPNLYVAREVSNNSFAIAGGTPGGKISWQVTGVRKDAYAEKHRVQVEEEKPAAEKGSCMHPEACEQNR